MAWWKRDKTEDSAVSVQTSEASKKAVWDSETDKAIADARKSQSRRLSGSKKGEQASEATQSGERLPVQAVEQIKKMFNPDAWRAIVKAPFALGQAITGRKCWELEKDKEDTLAVSTAMTAEYFLVTDPKWVAVSICAFNWAVILTEKLAANARERQKELELNPPPVEPKNPQAPPTMHRAPNAHVVPGAAAVAV